MGCAEAVFSVVVGKGLCVHRAVAPAECRLGIRLPGEAEWVPYL